MSRLRDLPGLGPKTEGYLQSVGINTPADLKELGAVEAFIRMKKEGVIQSNLNFLYALVAAVENRSWLDIARNERESLMMSLEGYDELEKELAKEGIKLEF